MSSRKVVVKIWCCHRAVQSAKQCVSHVVNAESSTMALVGPVYFGSNSVNISLPYKSRTSTLPGNHLHLLEDVWYSSREEDYGRGPGVERG